MKVNIIKSETYSTSDPDDVNKFLNETITERVGEDQTIINIQRIGQRGDYNFLIYTLQE